MRPPLTTSRSMAARRVPVLAAAATAATALVLAACGDGGGIDVETALATYPEVTDQVATAISGDVAPLADDGAVPRVDDTSTVCRVSGSTYESDDLISSEEAPTSEKLLAAAEPVLAAHGFGELDLEDEDSMPMQQFVATDGAGGSVRLVIESRPDRPTVQLWWSAPVETDGADCDANLME